MLESIQNDEVLFHELTPEEKESRGILGRLTGPIASFKKSTRNGRKYSEKLWENAFNSDIVKEMFRNGGLIGQLEHPEGTVESDPMKACILMSEPPKKDKSGRLIASVDILDTPCGQIAYALSKAGFKYGISSRGEGDVKDGWDGESIVDPDTYELTTFDLVALPACEEARLVFTESVETKKFDYKKYLKESYESSDEERKAVLSEEFNRLGIDILGESSEDLDTSDDDKDLLVEEPDEVTNDIEDISNNEDSEVVYPFTFTFRTEDSDLMVGIIEAENRAEAIKLFDEYCPDCEIENVRNGKLKGDYPEITPEFETTVLGKEPDSDQYIEDTEDVPAEDDGGVFEELQEALLQNRKLENKITSLNEELSVCYAKETKYKESLSESKSIENKLAKSNEKVESLRNKLEDTRETLTESQRNVVELKKQISEMNELIKNSKNKSATLSESVRSESDKAKVLAENIQKIQKKHKKEVEELNGSLEELTESYNRLKDDYSLKEVNFQKKIESDKKLVEKYKKVANAAVDKYVDLQARAIGVSSDMIKQKLPESYSFTDIDTAVKDLQDYTLSVSRLPFTTSRLNENLSSMEVKSLNKDALLPSSVNEDDRVDDSLMRMAGLA